MLSSGGVKKVSQDTKYVPIQGHFNFYNNIFVSQVKLPVLNTNITLTSLMWWLTPQLFGTVSDGSDDDEGDEAGPPGLGLEQNSTLQTLGDFARLCIKANCSKLS